MVVFEEDQQESRITLRSNRSATAQETFLFLVLLSSVVLFIGVFWFVAGAWAVLPCAGIEIMIVIFLMRRMSEETRRHQILRITEHDIELTEGRRKVENHVRIVRAQAVCQSIQHFNEHQLTLGDNHITVELGAFLTYENKQKLLSHLIRLGVRTERVNHVSEVVA